MNGRVRWRYAMRKGTETEIHFRDIDNDLDDMETRQTDLDKKFESLSGRMNAAILMLAAALAALGMNLVQGTFGR